MVAEDFFLDPAQGGPNSRHLRDDVDAISILLNHARESANLACYAAEAFKAGGFGCLLHT
jgi:hypothetical protein